MSATRQVGGNGSPDLYLAVFDLLSGGAAVISPEGRISLANENWLAFAREQGRAGDVVGADYLAARQLAAQGGDGLARQEWQGIQAVLQGSVPRFELEFSLPVATGLGQAQPAGDTWFSLRVTPLPDVAAGVLVEVANITRFRRQEADKCAQLEASLRLAQQALRHSDARWLTFFRASPVGISITVPETGHYIEVNETLVNMFGHSRESLLGSTSLDLGIWVDPTDRQRLIQTLVEQGKVQQFKARFRRKSGVVGTMQIAAELIFLDGHPHVLGIFSDITASEQQNEELRRAKQAAEVANRAKSAFLANMSHDIRTPMNAILGYAQLMQREQGLPVGVREKLDIINRSGQHLLALIEDVLEMSKIESGRVAVQAEAFNLAGLLSDLAVMFRLRAAGKKLAFKLVEERGVPGQIVADERKLRQILVNLLGNAVKFTDRGLVELRVATTHRQNQSWLNVKVTDTGPGIPSGELGKLFHQFEQTGVDRASNQGTGLGLAISREYARLLGGDITVESQEGQGSVFHLAIPVGDCAALTPVKPLSPRRVMGLQPGQPPVVVLLADDNATNRNWLKHLLMVVGCQVQEAENGLEAIRVWAKWRPRLILMDLQMPQLDGFEATRRIKASPGGESTVILALTATVQEESQRAILEAGAADLLGKPLEEAQLFDKMEALLGLKFIYESTSPPCSAEEEVVSPDGQAERLAKLPVNLRAALHDAIANGDLAGFEKKLGEVTDLDPALARFLRPLAETYDYDQLLRLLT